MCGHHSYCASGRQVNTETYPTGSKKEKSIEKNSVSGAKRTKAVKKAVSAVNANIKETKKAKKLEKKQAKKDLKTMKKVYTKALRKESPERTLSIIAVLLTFVSVILQVFFIDKDE